MLRVERLRAQHYVLFFCLTVLLSLALLFISSFMPQSLILSNISRSIGGLTSEGFRPDTFDRQGAASLDNHSDTEMLRATATMYNENLRSILTNDYYSYEGNDSIITDLAMYANGVEGGSVIHYVRYWMGFRAILRFLLVFLDYYQIRRYLGLLFFCILFKLVFHISKRTDSIFAYIFAISVILVRPNVIASSLQYSCCFLISFFAMFFVPWVYCNGKWEKLFFMEIGMITMYFDFYTVPLITYGYPMVYLLALHCLDGKKISIKQILVSLLYWFVGWGFMWIAKLGLTTLLTEFDGFANGFTAFIYRVGIEKAAGLEEYYSVLVAFRELFKVIFCDFKGAIVYVLGVAICICMIAIQTIKKKISFQTFFYYKAFLIISIIPIIWFVLTAQPIAIHAFYQYRSIAIIYWSLGVYIYMVFRHKRISESL